jgi:hypothetical protein
VGDDTWVWDPNAKSWTKVCGSNSNGTGSPCAPGRKEAATIVFDSVKQQILMFGGQAIYGPVSNATVTLWYYDAVAKVWTQAIPTGTLPPATRFPAAAFDSTLGLLVYHAGPGQTWTYDPIANGWTHLPLTGGPSNGGMGAQVMSMSYDQNKNIIVVHDLGRGNGGPADIWQLQLP